MEKNEEIKEVQQVNSKDEIKEKKRISLKLLETKDKIRIGILFAVFVYTMVLQNIQMDVEVTLGDFGSFVPLLFKLISIMGFKWLPVFSFLGIILVIFKNKFLELSKAYFWIVVIVTICSTIFYYGF